MNKFFFWMNIAAVIMHLTVFVLGIGSFVAALLLVCNTIGACIFFNELRGKVF